MGSGKNLPKDIINLWPEVFGDIVLDSVPYPYLDCIIITFENGKIWEVSAPTKKDANSWAELEINLKKLMHDYGDNISNVDFRLDTQQIKKDVTRKVKQFLKKSKL